jgi:soluble lytic murein transglycosylase-like protein
MPVTAAFVTGMGHGTTPASANLHDPSVNLEVGQLYVLYLAALTNTQQGMLAGGDLLRMLASYNAGPTSLAHWEAAVDHDDPLLFIETLPNIETRDYVHHALTYLWVYAGKMGLPTPSLAALARGQWPDFASERALAGRNPVLH